MRLFFLLLVLANLAFWFWHEPIAEHLGQGTGGGPARPAAAVDDLPRLVLLSERETDHVPAPEGPEAPVVPLAVAAGELTRGPAPVPVGVGSGPEDRPAGPERSEASPVCAEIGTWSEPGQAEDALAALGLPGRVEERRQERLGGYWIILPERLDRTGARAAHARLVAEGVEDLAVVALDDGWTISLGLFSRRDALERRRAEVQALGYAPEVRRRTETHLEYVIRLGPGADPDRVRMFAEADPSLEWRLAGCNSREN